MKLRINKIFIGGLLLGMMHAVFAQQETDSIDVQQVTVIKSFTPSLQDVFKIRQSPEDLATLTVKKQTVTNTIFSVPVASTFVPTKGSARKLVTKKMAPQFNSRASIGFGNYNQLLAEYGTYYALDRRQKIDWLLRYNGMLKDLTEVDLPTQQGNLMLSVAHQYATNKRNNFSQLTYRQDYHNFYGLRSPLTDEFVRENIDPAQQLNYISMTTQWQWYEPWVKQLDLNAFLTTDAFSTTEAEVGFTSKIQTLFGGVAITAIPAFDYLSTSFAEDFYTRLPVDYSVGKGDLALFASKIRGKFKFKTGARAVYGIGDEFSEKALYVFPIASFSYLPEKGNFAPFLHVDGDLNLNSFRRYTMENPYVAPGLEMNTSSVPYRGRLGTRSKFASGWEFAWNILYAKIDRHPLYRSLGIDIDRANIIPYRYNNAFEVTYTNLTQTGVEARLQAAFKNGGKLSLMASYADYQQVAEEDEVVATDFSPNNLPQLRLTFDGTINLGKKINVQWEINHWGERDNEYRLSFLGQDLADAPVEKESLEAFTQVDTHLTYRLNERWDVFLKGNNLLGEPTYRWSKYPVYGTQLLLGMRYNFDIGF